MKLVWWVLGGLLMVGLVWLLVKGLGGGQKITTYNSDDPNAPKLEISEKKFDFGKITLQDVAKHDFKVKNTGKSPLVIANLMTSCHCTTVILKVSGQPDSPEFAMHSQGNWQGEIPPGSEAVLEVIYAPAKMPVNGQVSRVVTFTSNDPNKLENQLEVVADVQ